MIIVLWRDLWLTLSAIHGDRGTKGEISARQIDRIKIAAATKPWQNSAGGSVLRHRQLVEMALEKVPDGRLSFIVQKQEQEQYFRERNLVLQGTSLHVWLLLALQWKNWLCGPNFLTVASFENLWRIIKHNICEGGGSLQPNWSSGRLSWHAAQKCKQKLSFFSEWKSFEAAIKQNVLWQNAAWPAMMLSNKITYYAPLMLQLFHFMFSVL